MAKTDLTNQRQVFVEEYVRSGDQSILIILIPANSGLITNCFAESSVKRSVSGVRSFYIAPNCQSEYI